MNAQPPANKSEIEPICSVPGCTKEWMGTFDTDNRVLCWDHAWEQGYVGSGIEEDDDERTTTGGSE